MLLIDFGNSIRGRFNLCTNPGNTGFDFVMVVGMGTVEICRCSGQLVRSTFICVVCSIC